MPDDGLECTTRLNLRDFDTGEIIFTMPKGAIITPRAGDVFQIKDGPMFVQCRYNVPGSDDFKVGYACLKYLDIPSVPEAPKESATS